jgi:preprotein translocase subunit YajC
VSSGGFLVVLIVLAAIWFFFLMPVRRQQRSRADSHTAMQDSLEVGDEIITAGGLHAIVRELGEDQLRVEIAPGVVATLDRRAVAAVATEVEIEVEPEPGHDAEPS